MGVSCIIATNYRAIGVVEFFYRTGILFLVTDRLENLSSDFVANFLAAALLLRYKQTLQILKGNSTELVTNQGKALVEFPESASCDACPPGLAGKRVCLVHTPFGFLLVPSGRFPTVSKLECLDKEQPPVSLELDQKSNIARLNWWRRFVNHTYEGDPLERERKAGGLAT